ncbi:hypothetical protein HPP92_018273 [Vanilla planifolia]|uniref:Non-haem dioxygenase N-terminal domain-containing protein n=1 Tax=Vanilla planifolia TaxID=51239 RepID=A0A835QE30_VANPL|nr:hypothetical protein HPP92_018892 [Vanilla planifolia]KAG0468945.1 hypothetical protein HPP92_018273 [Vanilla planifolia]
MAVETISLPSIDLANFPANSEKLTAAATGLGWFRVVNHGISMELKTEARAAASSFCRLSDDIKLRNRDIIYGSGFMSFGDLMPLLVSFVVYDATSTADVLAFCSSMEASTHQQCSCPPHPRLAYNIHGLLKVS